MKNMFESPLPKLVFKRSSAATTYVLLGDDRGWTSWACCTINDVTGELSVSSDWESWSYSWNPRHLGRIGSNGEPATLTEFIADRDPGHCDYLACKLCPSQRMQEFDEERTVDEIQRRIIDRRRDGNLSRDRARELYDDAEELRCETDMTEFVRETEEHELPQWAFDRCEDIVMSPTRAYRFLRDSILPALVEACKTASAARRVAPAAEGECSFA